VVLIVLRFRELYSDGYDDRRLRHHRRTSGRVREWVRPIILDEDVSLTTGTKRVVLAHNESWSEFCR